MCRMVYDRRTNTMEVAEHASCKRRWHPPSQIQAQQSPRCLPMKSINRNPPILLDLPISRNPHARKNKQSKGIQVVLLDLPTMLQQIAKSSRALRTRRVPSTRGRLGVSSSMEERIHGEVPKTHPCNKLRGEYQPIHLQPSLSRRKSHLFVSHTKKKNCRGIPGDRTLHWIAASKRKGAA